MTGPSHNCAGICRRDFLQLGLGGVLGLGFADALRGRALGAAAPALTAAAGGVRPVNCIQI
jgi:hypothetical protein